LIEGVILTPLKQIRDDRGAVLHMLRADASHFAGFGEVYFSVVNPGVIKGWRRHTQMVMSLTVPKGRIKLVLADQREGSSTFGQVQENIIGDNAADYPLVSVPRMVGNGFQCIGDEPASIATCVSIPHSQDRAVTISLDRSYRPFAWCCRN